MARNARRSTYRRKARRGSRTLSTRRIFNNKGAKAQAAQIYALRKSVNRVRRQCRPEIKEVNTSFDNRLLGQYISGSGTPDTVSDAVFATPMPTVGNGDNNRIGDLIRLLPLKFRMNLQYREVYGTAEGATQWTIPKLPTHGMQIRVIAVQAKASMNSAPTLAEILESYSTTSWDYLTTSGNMVQQFKNGITARFHILMNKVYSTSEDKPTLARTLSIHPRIRSVRWEQGYTYPRGQIFLFFFEGGAVSRTVVADPNNFYDYNATNIMFKFSQPYTDA
nr:MAG: capsid protein [Virus sp.]